MMLNFSLVFPSLPLSFFLPFSPTLYLPYSLPPPGLELCNPHHRLMASMVGGFFSVFAEVLLPGVAALCRDWPVLQAVATLPLLQLLSCWW